MQHIFQQGNSNLTKLWTIIEGEVNSERGKPIAMIHLEFQKALDVLERNKKLKYIIDSG